MTQISDSDFDFELHGVPLCAFEQSSLTDLIRIDWEVPKEEAEDSEVVVIVQTRVYSGLD